jgi:hypothetical protein
MSTIPALNSITASTARRGVLISFFISIIFISHLPQPKGLSTTEVG